MRHQLSNRISGAEAERHASELVKKAFEQAGWRALEQSNLPNYRPDLFVSRDNYRYVVEIKSVPRGSSARLEDSWSRACLQAQHVAGNDARPLAIVVAPRVSRAAVERLVEFAERYAPNVAMGVIDQLGLQVFRGPGLDALNRESHYALDRHANPPLVAKNLFSDLNQWLLKMLLAPELPEHLIDAPRAEYRHASALAEAAGCSVMSAHRFVEELQREGFLDEGARRLHVVRRAELFRRWKAVPSSTLPDIPLKLVVPRDVRSEMERLFPLARACLGLFAAADELGVGFVRGVPPYVLIDQLSAVLSNVNASERPQNMMLAGPGDPVHLIVRIPKAPRSVFRGAVHSDGVASADILQVWLDVSQHPSRGREQADLIWQKYLAPIAGSLDDE
jgi:Holliday junction resolvase